VTQVLFRNAVLMDPEAPEPRPGRLLVEGERIEAVLGPDDPAPEGARVVDLGGRRLAPGFIDVHFHGATIFDALDAPAASLRHDSASILRHGVTAFLPTTITVDREGLRHRVEGLARAASDHKEGAAVLGLHLEGPWISADAPGAQPRDAIRPYDAAEGRDVLDRGDGLVRMVTLAPEAPGAPELIAELERRGIVAALGHTRATAEATREGIDRGLRHVTHLFNAMGAFHHREPGAIGAALADDRATCDLICDGVHVHPEAVRAAARAKGEKLLLITDAIDPGDAGGAIGGARLAADGPAGRHARRQPPRDGEGRPQRRRVRRHDAARRGGRRHPGPGPSARHRVRARHAPPAGPRRPRGPRGRRLRGRDLARRRARPPRVPGAAARPGAP